LSFFLPPYPRAVPALLDLLLATRNDGKVAELRALLSDLPVRLHTLEAFPDAPEVVEDRPTLKGNARKKAEALAAFTGLPALADDTGLEVDALDGRPGVHTARFAGETAPAADNRRKLLRVLDGRPNRGAQFRTVVALTDPDDAQDGSTDDTHCVEGVCRGRIARTERGDGGFGYDEIFIPNDAPAEQTFAQMSAGAKNAVSHRRRALDALRAHLEARLSEKRQ
jgi:XTP/dITP diphosphohydrolase